MGGAQLPHEIEHIYPDYSIYETITDDTAYGFLTRGCPRGCDFCIVKDKEGKKSLKVANLSEFWSGQKNIDLLDPNMFACKDWEDLSGQLIESNAWVNFNQGCDIRIMTDNKIEALKNKGYTIHTHVKSLAASCGFVLFVSGNYRTISQFGYLLNHQGSSMTGGTVRDMEVSLDLTKKLEQQINDYIRKNTELSEDEIQRPYRTNTDIWYTSQEALDLKLVNKIENY